MILTGVFLTSSVSSGFQFNAASSSLFVHVELGTPTALVQLIALNQQCTASFNDLHSYYRRQPQTLSVVQLHIDLYTVVSKQFRFTHCQTVAEWCLTM